MKTSLALTVLTSTFALAAPALAADWEVDAGHSTVQFSVKHMMVTSVRGHFDKFAGTVNLDDKDPTKSSLNVTIETASINTRNGKRDEHLRSADFFDAAKNPTITFKSTKVEKAGKGKFKVTGDLTMRGVTKPVVLTVEGPTAPHKSPFGQTVRGVTATGKLNRKDWGLNWNKALEAGGMLVGEEVTLQIDAELVAKSQS